MTEEKGIYIVCAIALVVCIFMTIVSVHFQEEADKWKTFYVLANQLADSCIEHAPEQNCSHMEYPKHRWDYDNGKWICDE